MSQKVLLEYSYYVYITICLKKLNVLATHIGFYVYKMCGKINLITGRLLYHFQERSPFL